MKKTRFVGHLLAGSTIVFSTVLFASSGSCASYETQMKAYHEKLLAYKVQPGRYQAQRQAVCDKLKQMTSKNFNVDALWAKFDALERRAGARDSNDPTYSNDCNAFIKEVQEILEKHVKEYNADADAKNAASVTAARDQREAALRTQVDNVMKNYRPPYGNQLKRRERIWEELKRCYAQKKNISNHIVQLKEMDNALAQGRDVTDLCKQLENSLALPVYRDNE